MSVSPITRQSTNTSHRGIPARRVVINSESELPLDYGTTPGGTLFGTTPGGTRIVYERAFLLQMRQSPLARTPPANLPDIPGVTSPREDKKAKAKAARAAAASAAAAAASGEQQAEERGQQNGRALSPGKANVPASIKEEEGEQFSMDM